MSLSTSQFSDRTPHHSFLYPFPHRGDLASPAVTTVGAASGRRLGPIVGREVALDPTLSVLLKIASFSPFGSFLSIGSPTRRVHTGNTRCPTSGSQASSLQSGSSMYADAESNHLESSLAHLHSNGGNATGPPASVISSQAGPDDDMYTFDFRSQGATFAVVPMTPASPPPTWYDQALERDLATSTGASPDFPIGLHRPIPAASWMPPGLLLQGAVNIPVEHVSPICRPSSPTGYGQEPLRHPMATEVYASGQYSQQIGRTTSRRQHDSETHRPHVSPSPNSSTSHQSRNINCPEAHDQTQAIPRLSRVPPLTPSVSSNHPTIYNTNPPPRPQAATSIIREWAAPRNGLDPIPWSSRMECQTVIPSTNQTSQRGEEQSGHGEDEGGYNGDSDENFDSDVYHNNDRPREPSRQYITRADLDDHLSQVTALIRGGFEAMGTPSRPDRPESSAVERDREQARAYVSQRRRGGLPQRRSRASISFQKRTRDEFESLLGGNPWERCPSMEELAAFAQTWDHTNPTLIPCCNDANFRIDFYEGPHSPWNTSAVRVFVQYYARKSRLDLMPKTFDQISNVVFTRIKTLKAKFKKHRLPLPQRTASTAAGRRQCRKLRLFGRRVRAAHRHPSLRPHLDFLYDLGAEGMSSDESDHGDLPYDPPARARAPRFYIRRPRWRNPALRPWLDLFSVVDTIVRRTDANASRGAYPRLRVDEAITPAYSDSRKLMSSLPRNCYDPQWLAAHPDPVYGVNAKDFDYPLMHERDIFDLSFNRVSSMYSYEWDLPFSRDVAYYIIDMAMTPDDSSRYSPGQLAGKATTRLIEHRTNILLKVRLLNKSFNELVVHQPSLWALVDLGNMSPRSIELSLKRSVFRQMAAVVLPLTGTLRNYDGVLDVVHRNHLRFASLEVYFTPVKNGNHPRLLHNFNSILSYPIHSMAITTYGSQMDGPEATSFPMYHIPDVMGRLRQLHLQRPRKELLRRLSQSIFPALTSLHIVDRPHPTSLISPQDMVAVLQPFHQTLEEISIHFVLWSHVDSLPIETDRLRFPKLKAISVKGDFVSCGLFLARVALKAPPQTRPGSEVKISIEVGLDYVPVRQAFGRSRPVDWTSSIFLQARDEFMDLFPTTPHTACTLALTPTTFGTILSHDVQVAFGFQVSFNQRFVPGINDDTARDCSLSALLDTLYSRQFSNPKSLTSTLVLDIRLDDTSPRLMRSLNALLHNSPSIEHVHFTPISFADPVLTSLLHPSTFSRLDSISTDLSILSDGQALKGPSEELKRSILAVSLRQRLGMFLMSRNHLHNTIPRVVFKYSVRTSPDSLALTISGFKTECLHAFKIDAPLSARR
ncbi:hypothetical protein FA15DRAFT_710710 [Coprinopsis marcescibilis]|uniref:Uncharacterized protein n=1 Tax=Coprinopsis marcescibilis TaxID=230819 RepID=A0A5C3KCZ5_COPMA|nr:hypothetical protein FA15DRAFT_710710 [Coprinopsis marcescibilis]